MKRIRICFFIVRLLSPYKDKKNQYNLIFPIFFYYRFRVQSIPVNKNFPDLVGKIKNCTFAEHCGVEQR